MFSLDSVLLIVMINFQYTFYFECFIICSQEYFLTSGTVISDLHLGDTVDIY